MHHNISILVCGPVHESEQRVILEVLGARDARCTFCSYAAGLAILDSDTRFDMVVTLPTDIPMARFDEIDVGDWEAGLEGDLHARFRVAQAAVHKFADHGRGALLHVVPASGLIGQAEGGIAGVATMSAIALSRSIALDSSDTAIVSNVVALHTGGLNSTFAALMSFLVASQSKDVNGQVYALDGNDIYICSQPRPIKTAHRDGGWDQANLARVVGSAWRRVLLPAAESAAEVFGS